ILKNEHPIRISKSTNINGKYIPSIRLQTEYLGDLSNQVKYEGLESNKYLYNVSSLSGIQKAFLLTDYVFEAVHWDKKIEMVAISNKISPNIKSAYLLLQAEEGFYTKNLKKDILQEQTIVPGYVDLTKY